MMNGTSRQQLFRGLFAASLIGLGTLPALPQEADPNPAARWQERLVEIGEHLNDGRWSTAERSATELSREMAGQIVGGVGADLLLGIASTYRAVALAGQGREVEAIWQWQVAQQLFPRVAEIELELFGPEAVALEHRRPRQPTEEPPSQAPRAGYFEPPRRLESPSPEFPLGRALAGLGVDVVVQVIVGVDGRPRSPLILDSKGETTLVWAALEALRQWTFEPATRDGIPEEALYKLTVSFVVPDPE